MVIKHDLSISGTCKVQGLSSPIISHVASLLQVALITVIDGHSKYLLHITLNMINVVIIHNKE